MKTQRLLTLSNRLLSLWYLLLFIVTPFLIYHKTSELFEFNKILFIYLITGFVASTWIFKMILTGKAILKKSPIDLFVLLFIGSQILSTIFSIDVHTSIYGYYGRFSGGLLSTFCLILLYYAYVSNIGPVFEKSWVKKFLNVSVIISILTVVWGLSGWMGHDLSCLLFTQVFDNSCWTESFKPELRMFSTLGQPNWLGAYLAVNIPICLHLMLELFKKTKKLLSPKFGFYCLGLFTLISGVLATKSRSAMLAVLLTMSIYIVFRYLNEKNEKILEVRQFAKPLLMILIFGLVSLIIFRTGIPSIDSIVRPFNDTKLSQTKGTKEATKKYFISKSTDIRKIVWEGAIKLGISYPLFGTGVETFGYSYYFKRPLAHNLTSEWDYLYNRAHNEYLNYLATSGFTGAVTYGLLLMAAGGVILMRYSKDKNTTYVAIFCGWMSLLITNFFGFSTSVSNLYLFMLPAIALSLDAKIVQEVDDLESDVSNKYKRMFLIAPVGIVFLTLVFVASYLNADKNYNLGQVYLENQDYQSSISYLQRALTYKYEHVYEDKLAYALAQGALVSSLNRDGKYKKNTDALLNNARYYNQKTIKASPKNILYYKTGSKIDFLAYQITQNVNDFELSIDGLDVAESLAPTEPKIPYTKSLFYSSFYDQTKDSSLKDKFAKLSLSEANKAIKLKKDYRDAYFLKGNLLSKYGDKASASAVYQYILDNISSEDSEVRAEINKL